jgi:hypothetical protein
MTGKAAWDGDEFGMMRSGKEWGSRLKPLKSLDMGYMIGESSNLSITLLKVTQKRRQLAGPVRDLFRPQVCHAKIEVARFARRANLSAWALQDTLCLGELDV